MATIFVYFSIPISIIDEAKIIEALEKILEKKVVLREHS